MALAFDAYLVVDWSASSTPKTGADSIWWCLVERRARRLVVTGLENARTRDDAVASVLSLLVDHTQREKRVLVGFDFPYAYPSGLAARLGLRGTPWRAVWDELSALVEDDQPRSTNNRFEVAGQLNRRIHGGAGPFWGHPRGRVHRDLLPTAPVYPAGGLSMKRLCEAHIRGPQPSWKLSGVGSAGSQGLLGIPRVAHLRDHAALTARSLVWPFETGCALPRRDEALVVHAEIYPSLVPIAPATGRVKDSLQVEALARFFARADAAGTLAALFEAPARLAPEEVRRVTAEEGWILGVSLRESPRPTHGILGGGP